MKIVKFKGGLGNQLFQYAFLRNLEENFGCKDVKGDFFYYYSLLKDTIRRPRIENFNITMNKARREDIRETCLLPRIGNPLSLLYKATLYFEKTFNRNYFLEPSRKPINIQDIVSKIYFDGYWQYWKNVYQIEDILREELKPKFNISSSNKEIASIISREDSVFIGLRRGDYLANRSTRRIFGILDESYYKRAIMEIEKRVDNPVYYLFSDSVEWVKNNIDFGVTVNYRDNTLHGSDIEDLMIMSACKHAIIPNSTFHWWGAWLIENRRKIIVAPDNWFADGKEIEIVPPDWIKIER
jgi:hypothetical protein